MELCQDLIFDRKSCVNFCLLYHRSQCWQSLFIYMLLKVMIQLPCNIPCRYEAIIKHICYSSLHLIHFHVSRSSAFREARLPLGSSLSLSYHPEPLSAISMSESATACKGVILPWTHYIRRSLSWAKTAARCKRNLSRYDCYHKDIPSLATSPQTTAFSSKQKN